MRCRRLLLVPLALLPSIASAQEDFRTADLDRPIRIEDADPIDFREWEFEIGSRGSLAEGGARGLSALFELKTGLFRNVQLGVELESAARSAGSGAPTEAGIEAAEVHLLYGLWRETPTLPAAAVRVEVATPGSGAVGHHDGRLGAKGIVTRSIGRVRVHGNGGYVAASGADGGDFWRLGIGGDYPVGLFSRAILADLYVELPASDGRSRVWVEVGSRFQVSNSSVIDLGLATRLDEWDEGRANLEIVIGLSRAFGFTGRVAPYPDPAIR